MAQGNGVKTAGVDGEQNSLSQWGWGDYS
jgi:hypothetical protein